MQKSGQARPPWAAHPARAARAANADIRPEPNDPPGVRAAGVRLPQHDDIVKVER